MKPEAAQRLAALGLHTSTTLECRIVSRRDDPHLLPRLIDGDNISEIEFEAEISGFLSMLWRLVRRNRDGSKVAYIAPGNLLSSSQARAS